MIDPFELYQSFKSYVNTDQNGWFRPQTDFQRACNDISKELWVKWTNEAEKSQEAKDNLQPFLQSKNMIVSNSSVYGTFKPPKEYGRFATARIIVAGDYCVPCKEVDEGKCSNGDFKTPEELKDNYYDSIEQFNVDMIDTNKLGAMNEHLTKKPTLRKPKMRQIDGGFQVAPRKVSVIVLDYYVEPKLMKFAYTISPGNVQTGAGDQLIYDKDNSKPLEWTPTVINEFLERLKIWYSRFVRDQVLAGIDLQQKEAIKK